MTPNGGTGGGTPPHLKFNIGRKLTQEECPKAGFAVVLKSTKRGPMGRSSTVTKGKRLQGRGEKREPLHVVSKRCGGRTAELVVVET